MVKFVTRTWTRFAMFGALIFAGSGLAEAGPQDDRAAEGDARPTVIVGTIEGAIGPVTKDYVHRVLQAARAERPACVIFTIDTPGGLDASMRSIIKDILSSPVPVVTYVYPSGARAASAGALISLSSHIAAMAPSTNIGAAHPVSLGGGQADSTMMAKVTNDAAAFARGLAQDRGRDVEWAEKIVRESISSTEDEVLDLGVIEIIAANIEDLIEQLDGRTVEVNGSPYEITTRDASITAIQPTFREKFLALISDPNIAYLLMLLGIFGIFFELQNPGAIFPGAIGGIAILMAFFALQLLPVNYAGLALIILGIIMFLLEIKITSGGLLTVGGAVAMFIGSIMFIDSSLPFMRVSLSVIIPAVVFSALFFLFVVGIGLKAQKKKVQTGDEGMVGETGVAKTDISESGSVFVHGEHWNAFSRDAIPEGAKVEVVAVDGLTIEVRAVAK